MRLILLAALLALAACAQAGPTCTEPYIANGNTCCLDKDGSGVCDIEEGTLQQEGQLALDCSLCAPQFVTDVREQIIYKYVCVNESIVDDPSECHGVAYVSDAAQYTPLITENGPNIAEFDSRPACRGSFLAAELHISLSKHPQELILEVMREPGTTYENLLVIDGRNEILDDKYLYVGFCADPDCNDVTDAQLPATKAYMLRMKANFANKEQYTEEIVLDPTPSGRYSQQVC